ncbi:hypothetical protein [Streptomyces sp. NPDC090135]|uniref:hypothetical protein n=1 Tax=Streptomyces sp. NPDC090135 TaxID=3365957 RepID=UPI0037F957CC
MGTTGQSGDFPDTLSITFIGSSHNRKMAVISVFSILMGALSTYNAELTLQQKALYRSRLKNHRAEASSGRLSESRLVGIMAPADTRLLRMGKTHEDQRVNTSLTYLTSRFTHTQQETLALMNLGQGPTWYHLPPDGKTPVRLTAASPLLAALPCPEPEAQRPLEVARLLATLSHRFFARSDDRLLPSDLPAPPPGSENTIHLTV